MSGPNRPAEERRSACTGCGGAKPAGIGVRFCEECRTNARHHLPQYLDAIIAKSERTEGGCLIFGGRAKNQYGYTQVSIAGRNWATHRYVYERLAGAIPQGLVIDHLCMQPRCIEVDHLEPVTDAANKSRSRKPFCRRGHLLAQTGLDVAGLKGRGCHVCRRDKARERSAARRRAELAA